MALSYSLRSISKANRRTFWVIFGLASKNSGFQGPSWAPPSSAQGESLGAPGTRIDRPEEEGATALLLRKALGSPAAITPNAPHYKPDAMHQKPIDQKQKGKNRKTENQETRGGKRNHTEKQRIRTPKQKRTTKLPKQEPKTQKPKPTPQAQNPEPQTLDPKPSTISQKRKEKKN